MRINLGYRIKENFKFIMSVYHAALQSHTITARPVPFRCIIFYPVPERHDQSHPATNRRTDDSEEAPVVPRGQENTGAEQVNKMYDLDHADEVECTTSLIDLPFLRLGFDKRFFIF